MNFDWSRVLDNAIGNVPLLLAAIWLGHWRLTAIEKKLDTFISKDTVTALKDAANQEHAAIRREINGVRAEIHHEA